MLYDIVDVQVIKEYTLHILFENGVEGDVDISQIVPFVGIFSKLKDKQYFSTVHVNNELGTIVWDNGADISPSFLYSLLSNEVA